MARKRFIPVTKETIIWARVSRGLDRHAAATLLGVTDQVLSDWENGEALPDQRAFNKMRVVYHRSPAVLLMPFPPKDKPPPKDFRAIGNRKRLLTPSILLAVREARALQDEIAELIDSDPSLLQQRTRLEPAIAPKADVEAFAAELRAVLRMNSDLQRRWPRESAFKNWRLRMQELGGVLVLMKKMPPDECLGFALHEHPVVHTIVVNKDDPIVERQTFTLMHEYGHILQRTSGICLGLDGNGEEERWCNLLAWRSFWLHNDYNAASAEAASDYAQ